MSETVTQKTTEIAPSKGKTKQKASAKAAAKAKTPKAAKPKPEGKPKAPRESRDGWGTFALRLPVLERDAFHTAAGPANASRAARSILNAFANEDEAAFKAAIVDAKKLTA